MVGKLSLFGGLGCLRGVFSFQSFRGMLFVQILGFTRFGPQALWQWGLGMLALRVVGL